MKTILNFSEFVNENLNEESFSDFNKSSGFKMDSKAKSTLKKLNVNPTKLKDAFDDYSKIMKYLDSNGKKIGTVSIPNPGSKSNPEFMYTVYDTDMYGKVLTGDGDSVFIEMVKESLNEGEFPSWVDKGRVDSLKDMFAYIGGDIQNADGSELTVADVNKNYKPALKYLGVRSIDDMGMIASSIDNDDMFDGADAIDKQMKSSNFLGDDRGKGMNPTPYTAAYKGMVGDMKVIITQDINGENTFVFAATKGGKLK